MLHRSALDRRPPTGRRSGVTIALLATAQLMLVLDVTVVNVALPEIGSSLGLDRGALTWVMTIYTTLFGGLVLVGGKAADLFGARRVLIVGLVLFVGASLACALAWGAGSLLVGRAVQGVGAALVSPAALAVLLAHVTGAARARALAVWGGLSAVGAAVGVSLGGILTSAWGWEWIFAINVPLGVALLVALPVLTTSVGPTPRAGRPDLAGAVLVTAGTASIVYGIVAAGDHGWGSVPALAAFAAGAALWAAFVAVERRVAEPVLRIGLLVEPPIAAGVVLMLVATGLMVGNFFLGSFVLQRAFGDDPLAVGGEFLPIAVAVGAGAQLGGRVLRRVPPRWVAVSGLAVAALGEGVAAAFTGSRVAFVAGLAVAAAGIGATFVTAFTTALAAAPDHDRGLRSAVVSTAHELGGAFGVAVVSTVAGSALARLHPSPADFSAAFVVGAVAAAAAALVAAVLVPAAGGGPVGGARPPGRGRRAQAGTTSRSTSASMRA